MTPTAITQHQSVADGPDATTASEAQKTFVAFDGFNLVAKGNLREVATAATQARDRNPSAALLILDAVTSRPVELDLRGELQDVLARLEVHGPAVGSVSSDAPTGAGAATTVEANQPATAPRGAGRPRLGVVAREVTLLPRHWAWLADQPGGASAALRRLVEQARVDYAARDALRHAQESAYRFMSTLLGDQADYDEAARALFAGHREEFRKLVRDWPAGARDHLLSLADVAFNS